MNRDESSQGAAATAALRELVAEEGIIAVFGGIYSPVMPAQIETNPSVTHCAARSVGSASAITYNTYSPNYACRISVSDPSAAEFLMRYVSEAVAAQRLVRSADTGAWRDSARGWAT